MNKKKWRRRRRRRKKTTLLLSTVELRHTHNYRYKRQISDRFFAHTEVFVCLFRVVEQWLFTAKSTTAGPQPNLFAWPFWCYWCSGTPTFHAIIYLTLATLLAGFATLVPPPKWRVRELRFPKERALWPPPSFLLQALLPHALAEPLRRVPNTLAKPLRR